MSDVGRNMPRDKGWRGLLASSADLLRRWRRRVPVILQTETTECSLACLAMIASFHGFFLTVAELRARYPVSLRGLTLRTVVEIASDLGLRTRPVRCEPEDLRRLGLPAMLHWDLEHFVVLTRIKGNRFEVNDPGRGIRSMTIGELGRHFTGIAVEFERTVTFHSRASSERLTLRALTGRVTGMRTAFASVLGLSFVLECLLLAQPMLLRYTIDFGFIERDDMLVAYLCAFGIGAALCAAAVSFARDRATVVAGSELNLRMAHSLFAHSLSLPIAFYEKRLTGDLVDRYRSIEHIERFTTGELPLAVLDGTFTLVSLLLLLVISPAIAMATLCTFGVFALCRWLDTGRLRDAEEAVVAARGQETGYLFESIQAMLSIKVRAAERDRQGNWLSHFIGLLNAQSVLAVLQARQRSVKVLLGGIDVALFAAVAYGRFTAGAMSVGALLAILFYKTHFFARSTALVERLSNLRMLRIHLDRLEDIVHAEPERIVAMPATATTPLASEPQDCPATLRLADVRFRYSPFDPWILDRASLAIEPGEFVALTGPSGTGKTTVLKLLLGLYPVESGSVEVAGRSVAHASLPSLRRDFGVVMQDDQLLVGTVAQNVSFFDPDIDIDRVAWCCGQACIHEEVNALPMGYSTRIGGNAAGLSGGQRQRILLARALYRDVRFLLLDEGTANLDLEREADVIANLRRLSLTTLVITHGDRALAAADRIITMQNQCFT